MTAPVPYRTHPVQDDVPLTEWEAGYVEAARAANTLRGYRSDWHEFAAWCDHRGDTGSLPAAPAQISTYLTELAPARRQGRHAEPQTLGDPVRSPAP